MSFKEKIIENMVEKNLSKSSINNYIRNLEILNDGELSNLNFLKKKENIMKKIETKKPNTQRSYLISIISVLNANEAKKDKLYKFYYDKMMDLNKSLKEQEQKHEKTETQEKNWIEKDEIDKKLNELVDKVKTFDKKNITPKEYDVVLQMIILSLYTLQAPRRNADYQYMVVVNNKVPDEKINFLVYEKKEFWFRKYKTAKTELKDKKELIIEINEKLFDNIKLYFEFHPMIKGKKINDKKIQVFYHHQSNWNTINSNFALFPHKGEQNNFVKGILI